MLASLSPAKWRELKRFDRIEMDPIDRLTEVVKRLCVLMSSDCDMDDFEPEEWRKTSEVTPDQMVAARAPQIQRGGYHGGNCR